VSGNNVSITGLLALVDTVGSAHAGFTVKSISSNVLNGSGQVTDNPSVITLSETGSFVASGTYSLNGQTGSFTETITTSSTATFSHGGIITTVAGGGFAGFYGDGGPAKFASLDHPSGVAVDSSGNLFIADSFNHEIRKVTASTGVITTVAGNGVNGYGGDGGPATKANLWDPMGVAVDHGGNLYIADTGNSLIRQVTPDTGLITKVAGGGNSGDGGTATSARLNRPAGIAVDSSGNLYFADSFSSRIRKVTASTGVITTVAGGGSAFPGDNGLATSASLNVPQGVDVDSSGNLYIADTNHNLIRKVTASTGVITTVAGGGNSGLGDGGPATSASLSFPWGVTLDASGNLFIADWGDGGLFFPGPGCRIREVSHVAAAAPSISPALRMGVQFKALSGSTVIRSVVISFQ
jgi:sugar lactone lactonase YvrE